MCNEVDTRHQHRDESSYTIQVSINTTWTLLLPRDEMRVAAVIGMPTGQNAVIYLGTTPTAIEGIWMPASSAPLSLSVAIHGDMVKGPIWAAQLTSAANLTVMVSSERY